MGPSQICGSPFREPRVFEIAQMGPTWAKVGVLLAKVDPSGADVADM